MSPRRAGVISPAGRRDDRFMVGPRGHATGALPASSAGLIGATGGFEAVRQSSATPQSPIGPTARSDAREPRVLRSAALVTPRPVPREACQLAQPTCPTRFQGLAQARPASVLPAGQPQDGRPDRAPTAAGLGPAPWPAPSRAPDGCWARTGRSGRAGARAGQGRGRAQDRERPAAGAPDHDHTGGHDHDQAGVHHHQAGARRHAPPAGRRRPATRAPPSGWPATCSSASTPSAGPGAWPLSTGTAAWPASPGPGRPRWPAAATSATATRVRPAACPA